MPFERRIQSHNDENSTRRSQSAHDQCHHHRSVDGATRLAAVTAEPLLPLGLTVFSLEQLLTRIVKILF